MRPNLDRYHALLLSDLAQCGQVILNSLRHDRRLLEFLDAGPQLDRAVAAQLRPMLWQMERELDGLCGTAIEAARRRSQAASAPHDLCGFIDERLRLGHAIEGVLQRSGTVHQELRAVADAMAPDVASHQWTRLETADHYMTQVVADMALCATRRMGRWLSARLELPECTTRVSINLAHRTKISMFTCPPRGAADPQGWSGTGELHLALSVPFWLLYLPRYLPTLAHEIAHPFVECLLGHDDEIRALFLDTVEDVKHLCHALFDAESRGYFEGYAAQILDELLCDALALRLAGPAYLPALALMLTGAVRRSDDPTSVRYAPPVAVRLGLLLHEAESRWPDGPLRRLRDDIRLHLAEDQTARRTTDDSALIFEARLLELARGFVDEVMRRVPALDDCPDCAGDEPPLGVAAHSFVGFGQLLARADEVTQGLGLCATCRSANFIWQTVEVLYRDTPQLPETLQALPEGLLLFRFHPTIRVAPLHVELGESWEMALAQVRFPPRGVGESEACRARASGGVAPPMAALQRAIEGAFGKEWLRSGLVGMALGPYDLVGLRPGFRVRERDRFPDAESDVRAYLKRRILLELSEARDTGGRVLHRSAAGVGIGELEPNALTEVRLRPGAGLAEFFRELGLVGAASKGGIQALLVFLGTGWSHLTVLWRLAHGGELARLHQALLAGSPAGLVERSVTYLLTHWSTMKQSDLHPTWVGAKPWGSAMTVTASVRAHRATDIARIHDWFAGPSAGARGDVQSVFGLHDAVVRFTARCDADVIQVAETLARALQERVVGRSVCQFSVPTGRLSEA